MAHLILPGKLGTYERRHTEIGRPVRDDAGNVHVWAPGFWESVRELRAATLLEYEGRDDRVARFFRSMPRDMRDFMRLVERIYRPGELAHGAATAWAFYDSAREYMATACNFDSDSFIIVLGQVLASTNLDDDTLTVYASATGELASSNGYTQKTEAVLSPAMTYSGATATWDSGGADPAWTASGGTLGGAATQVAAILDDTVASPVVDPMICWSDIDNGGSGLTIADGETLTIQFNASGIFTITGA